MQINTIEIVNVVVAFLLLGIAINRNSIWLLLAFFTYGSLYFLYSAVPLISGSPLNEISAMHVPGAGGKSLVKLSTLLFLFVMFIALGIRTKKSLGLDKRVNLHFMVVMVVVFFGYLINLRIGDWLQLQNVVGIVGMLALILFGYIGLKDDFIRWKINPALLSIANGILVIVAGIAFYEVFTQRAWAGTALSSGLLVSRASSIFFNPNLFAFWSSLIFIGCAYGMHEFAEFRKSMFLGMSLSSIGIYFSGARSASFLLLGVLFLCAILIKDRRNGLRWIPLITMPLIFLIIYSTSRGVLSYSESAQPGWQSVAILGERFAETPLNVLQYTLNKIPFISKYQWVNDYFPVPMKVVESIEGRFMVDKSDSGFLTLLSDTGLFGAMAFIWLWGVLFVWSLRTYVKNKDAPSVYSFGMLLYCFLVGLAMRFQVFPVWLLIGVNLAPCMVAWRKST